MDDLVKFLRARLDDDEAAARAASEPESWMELNREPRPNWHVQYWADPDVAAAIADPESSAYPVATTPEGMDEADAAARIQHIVRHDPARVLREVEAKRQLILWYEKPEESTALPDYFNRFNTSVQQSVLVQVLRHLALPYADHPDYREEWRP